MKLKIILLSALFFVAAFGIQAQNAKSRTAPLGVGASAPDFTLPDQNGKTVTLSKIGKPTVVVFYRGYW